MMLLSFDRSHFDGETRDVFYCDDDDGHHDDRLVDGPYVHSDCFGYHPTYLLEYPVYGDAVADFCSHALHCRYTDDWNWSTRPLDDRMLTIHDFWLPKVETEVPLIKFVGGDNRFVRFFTSSSLSIEMTLLSSAFKSMMPPRLFWRINKLVIFSCRPFNSLVSSKTGAFIRSLGAWHWDNGSTSSSITSRHTGQQGYENSSNDQRIQNKIDEWQNSLTWNGFADLRCQTGSFSNSSS